MQMLLDWVALPLLAACFAVIIESLIRRGEDKQMVKLKDHEKSWKFVQGRKFRLKLYFTIVAIAAMINVGFMAWIELVHKHS